MLFLCTNENGSKSLASQPILVLMAITQIVVEPFRDKRINIISSVLFFDLIVLNFYVSGDAVLESEAYDLKPWAEVIVYVLTLTPLVVITTALALLLLPRTLLVQMRKSLASSFRRKRRLVLSFDEQEEKKRDQKNVVQEMAVMTGRPLVRADFGRLREPLLDSV